MKNFMMILFAFLNTPPPPPPRSPSPPSLPRRLSQPRDSWLPARISYLSLNSAMTALALSPISSSATAPSRTEQLPLPSIMRPSSLTSSSVNALRTKYQALWFEGFWSQHSCDLVHDDGGVVLDDLIEMVSFFSEGKS